MSTEYDLLILLRCHTAVDFILDTVDSVLQNTDPSTTKLVVAVDGNNKELAQRVTQVLGLDAVYCSPVQWGWGAGLYGLLSASILWAREVWNFRHLMSIDYDTLFIKPEVDYMALRQVTSPSIGLIGHYSARNIHWRHAFTRDKLAIRNMLGEIPRTYIPGEGVQGGCFLMTERLLKSMKANGMLVAPFATATAFTSIADDHLITLFTRMCGLEIVQISEDFYIRWQLDCDPLGLSKTRCRAFHPTKIRPSPAARGAELQVRNYYREIRGRELLK